LRNSIVVEAQERAQALLAAAEARARETVAEADATAAAHLSEAAEAATKEMDDADEYSLEVLRRLQAQLNSYLDSIKTSISSLEERR
jgi:F0F1-type ATP synthase membrane subunit b/b'